jgi:class 3 adenylate cyclase
MAAMDGASLPAGTVTFLFTDVEGSTRLLKRAGTTYGAILGRHHELVRESISRHGGSEIDTQGEAFFVAFPRAKDTVAAAVEIQLAHAAEDWPGGVGVLVRIGVHTAEPDVGAGGYFGMGVHRAARICAVAHGGQVLLSRSSAGLVDEDEVPEIALRDLGEHLLKDLERPERIYQLLAPGLAEEFPPIRSLTEVAREAGTARLPSGIVTFVATDVVGFGDVVGSHGPEALGRWVDTYEGLVETVAAVHEGAVLEFMADTALIVFSRARDAVAAGFEILDAVAGGAWPRDPPSVRIGVHTGEAEPWRSRYLGQTLMRAVAVCGAADGNQVVLTQATESVLDRTALEGVEIRLLGPATLATVADPVVLYEAVRSPRPTS